MRTLFKRVCGALLVTTTLATSLLAQSGKSEVEQLNRQYAKDLVAKDYLAIERFMERSFSRDFKWQKSGGPAISLIDLWEGNRQDIANKKNGVADGPLVFKVSFANWKEQGDDVSVDIKTTGRGEWHKDEQWIPVTFRLLVRQTWRRLDGRWKAVQFRDLSVEGKFGKPQRSRLKA